MSVRQNDDWPSPAMRRVAEWLWKWDRGDDAPDLHSQTDRDWWYYQAERLLVVIAEADEDA